MAEEIPNGIEIANWNTIATAAIKNEIHIFSEITLDTSFPYTNDLPKSPLIAFDNHLKYPSKINRIRKIHTSRVRK